MLNSAIDVDALIDDRPADGVFRVRRDIFNDPRVFDLEMAHIFEATWVYVGLESQIAQPHDFITTTIGRQPVIVMRGVDGHIGSFINSCRHRGTLVCPLKSGNQKQHVCRYHGWAYDSSGKNIAIPGLREGQYPDGFESLDHNLVRVPRLENYRGFLFASLSADVPPLEHHLGEVRLFLDLMADQAPQGLELVPGEITYTFDANWKFQFENGLDAYHFPSTHGSYMEVIRMRADGGRTEGTTKHVEEEPPGNGGSFSFERGHALMWSNRNAARIRITSMYEPCVDGK
jgi:phenylpropionate dioxygenase-like ring-hydroxylating dioxygenase large terminal subunit